MKLDNYYLDRIEGDICIFEDNDGNKTKSTISNVDFIKETGVYLLVNGIYIFSEELTQNRINYLKTKLLKGDNNDNRNLQ
ncbi:MAG: hypothetical protein ACK5LT_02710 [Lachnospirales bacterium]